MDVFKFTEDQQLALKLIGGTVRNLLLFGGSRSGKTLILLFSIVLRALKAPGSRHAVFRFRKIHVREAALLDTFPKLMKLCFSGDRVQVLFARGLRQIPQRRGNLVSRTGQQRAGG